MTKYNAKRTTVDGITFASQKEARRYQELKLLERAGKIHSLELQRRYPLKVEGELICTYVADFVYGESDGTTIKSAVRIVEDTKGFQTREYKIKKKLMKAIYGIEIQEV